jgi:hypothetical protein
MLNVTLYTRKDCKLCDEVKADLNELQSQYPSSSGGSGH